LTGGVAKTARYDARRGFIEDAIDPRFNRDDPAWNPVWNYDAGVAAKRESWSALLTIPFESLEVAPPGSGTEWKGNFGRLHQARPGAPREVSLWSANPDTTAIEDRQAFGRLVFE